MGKSLKSLKSLMQIFATYATYASANFVGKESCKSTVRYALWSRISLIKPLLNPYLTLTRFRLSLGSNLSRSRSACAPRTPSLFKDKSQLYFPSLASLICLCMLTVGSGNVWADYTVTFSTSSFAFASGGEYVSSSEKSTNGWEATTDGFKYGASRNTGYTEFTMKSSGTDIGQIKASKITFKDVLVYSSDGSSLGYIITYVGGVTKSGTVLAPASAADKDVELDDTKTIQKIKIYSTANKKRFYCKGFTVVAAAAASCGLPTSPSNGAKTAATQPVSWTAPSPAPASGYLVAIGATSTPPGDDVKVNSSQQYGDYYVNVVSAGTTNLTFTSSNGAWVAGEEYHWWVRSKCGASDYSAWVAGTAFTIPNIETSTTAIEGLGYDVSSGGPGTAQSFTVSGAGLTGNLTASLKSGSDFEISQTNATSGFANSLTLTQSSGTVSATIWVRLKSGKSAGDYLEEITISGGTATSKTVAIEGVVCTLLSTPTSPVVDLNYEEGGYTYVKMSWSTASDITDHATYLDFAFGPSGSSTPTYSTSSAPANAHSYKYKKSLLSDGTYWWKVRALGDGSSYCDGAFLESTFTICTKDVSGETPIVNAATSIGKYGATANWSAVTDADHYTVKVYRGSNASGTLEKTYSNVTGTSQVITGLSSVNTTYYIEVQAHDACGHDSSKGGVTFTTLNLTLYTVTFVNAAGEAPAAVTQLSEGGTVSIPSVTACDGWEFAGWKIGSAQSSVTSDPTGSGYIKNATYPFNYTPTGNITVYSVFKKTTGGGGDPTAYSAGDVGSYVIASNVGENWYALPTTPTVSSGKITGVSLTVSETAGGVKYVTSANASGKTWTIANATNGQSISDGTKTGDDPNYIHHANGGSTGTNLAYGTNSSGYTWNITSNQNGLVLAGQNGQSVGSRGMLFNGSVFGGYSLGNAGQTVQGVTYYYIQILPIASSGTTTWKSDVSCNCPNYSFHSKNSSSVWDDPICFAQVGSSTLYRTEEIELPTDGVSFKVGWHDADDVANAKTNEKDWQYMVAGPTTTRSGGGYWTVGGHLTSGNTGGAKGYFYVYSDSNEDNKYVGFTPSGYVLRWGKSESWTSKAFTAASASIDETEWNTEAVTLSSSNASDHIYVGLKTESGYVWCNNSEEQRVIFLSPGVWDSEGCKFGLWDKTHLAWRGFMQDADGDGVYEGTVPSSCTEVTFARFDGAKTEPAWDQQYNKSADQTISSLTDKNMFSVTGWGSTYCEGDWNTVYSKPGVFRINAGSNLKNWSCKFVPHFVLTYNKNNNDATGTMSPTTVASDAVSKNVSVSACGFTGPTGYHFDHWDTAPDGSGTDYDPNDTYSLTADVTLYAIWSPNTHTLTWEYDGGTPSGTYTAAGTIAYGTALTAPTMTKTGYSFNVWSPSVPATMPDNDATYTATWTANTYSVRFNANGGSGSMSNQNFTYGVAQNLTSNGFTAPSEKSFGGWTTNSDGTGDLYTNGQSVSNLSSTQGAVVDLYAKWVDCDLYTVTLKVNGDTWKTVTQGSCGASIDLSSYQDVPNCDAKYTFVGWSETNSAAPMFDAPTITKTSSYTPESDVTLYAVYSYTAKVGTKVKNLTGFGGMWKSYILVANGYDRAMYSESDTVHVAKSGDNLVVTSNRDPEELYFSSAGSNNWLIYSPYISSSSTYEYKYYEAPTVSSGGSLGTYDDWAFDDWNVGSMGSYDYDAIEAYIIANKSAAVWTVSVDASGVATISANSRYWKHKTDKTFKTYSSGQSAVALYEYNASGTAYTTQPSMTYYTISKGSETNGTYTISQGVVCSGGSVTLTATPDPGYTLSGWTSTNGGSFSPNATNPTSYTIGSANTTLTANFVAAVSHDITWMVNGVALTSGAQTASLTAGTSFSTMTLPTAPANNTLSSACSAVANQFVGWSKTDMGFATGQSAPTLFTDAAGAGSAYGVMGGEDVTFYAVFAQDGSSNYMSRCPHTYSIVLDKKEGSADGSATATEMGTSLTDIVAPTRTGYSIEGYYAETGRTTKIVNANGTLVSDKAGYTDATGHWINTTSPLTLYTQWNIITYNLTYENLNGASNSNPATYQVTTATINLADPGSRTGYMFTGWTCGGSPITQITVGSIGDKTITANWDANQYAITYMDKDGAAYSGDKTDGRPTGCPANHTYGSATDLPYGVKAGYRFDGWFTTSACTGDPITSIASDAEGPFTFYAKWTASHTFTFSKNGVVDGELTLGQVEGGNVVMPSTTVDCGLWTTFEGWVESNVAETTTEPATIYKPGDIFVAGNSDQEFKALYSKHEGDATVYYEKVTSGPKSGTYVMVSSEVSEKYYTTTGWNSSIYSTAEVTVSANGTISAANAASASANVFTIHAGYGVNAGKFAIYDGSKYMASGSSVSRQDAHSYTWELLDGSTTVNGKDRKPAAGAIHSTSATDYCLQYNSGQPRFAMYGNTQKDVFLYRKRVAGTTYYTTAPGSCEVPTKITVSYNDNKANAGDQTISGMPSGTTLTFTEYPNFASYTIGSAPTDPTGYHFAGWNTSVDGSGDGYTAGASVTTFGYTETITLYAQWERVYTVTLMDNGVERETLVEASAGAGVTLPSGNNCTPSSTFTFVGWTESAVQLNADPVRPATLHAAGSYVPTSDITLYSVYSKSVAGCDDFAAGVSGAYKMYYDGSKYATTDGTSGSYTGATSGTAEVFYIAYAPSHTGYTIRTSTGFVGWNYNGEELTKGNATPYYWKISGSSSNWVITPEPSAYTRQLKSSDGSKFQLYAAATNGKLLLQQSAMTYYYNTAICEEAQVTFHDGGGAISGMPTTPDGASWNSGTHVLSGLEDCDKITTFPTVNYDGWTFVGWSTEDYTNSGKHVTDYAEENASTDEPDGSIIYKTGGNSYTIRGGSVDLYPVFTRFPDNEPFDLENGGDYYIYYLKPGTDDGYGDPIRVYAGAYDGDKRYSQTISCTAATTFTFTKEGDVWHIYDKTTGKYLKGRESNDDLQQASDLSGELDDWTITIKNGNQFDASCQGYGRYLTFSTSANYFMDYSVTANQTICMPVYLGSCTERIYSSEPSPVPTIDLTGEPMVTSSVGQTVRATETMTLSGSHLTGATKITLTGTNLKFATSTTDAPVASLDVAVTSGNVAATNIYVYYTPTATEDGIENVIITATDNGTAPAETKAAVQVRHLPADFVIAAKIGDKWYALPADINSSSANTAGVLIEVDNASDPTAATAAPMNTKWGLRNVKTTRQTTNGLGDYLTFTERETATADNQKTLYNGSGTNIQTNAQWSNYAATNPEKYEWIPTTADFKDYTLTSAAEIRTLSLNTSGVFGSLTQSKAYDGKVRLLPASFYEPAEMQVVEWKASSVVVLYTGSGTTATTKVGTGSESSAQTLTAKKIDHGVFELTTGTLTGNANKVLTVTIKNGSSAFVGKTMLTIPAIVSVSTTAPMGIDAAATSATDVVVLDGATLSATATKYTFKNITVYPGGKLVIGSGKQLGMASLTLRGGSAWGAATYEHKYPQFVVNDATDGAYSNTSGVINYDYVTTKDQYYSFVLPYASNTKNIKYPLDIYGSAVSASNTGSFEFQYYDGAARAAGGTGWKVLEEDPSTGADLVVGKGYTFLGMPKKVDAYDGTDDSHANTRQRYGIHRIPMSVAATAVQAGETGGGEPANKPISINVTLASKNNDSGWNLVGNPYMANVSGLTNEDIQVGQLVHTSTVPWDGKWQWDNPTTGVRYIVTTDDGQNFESEQASTATLKAFKNFFVQIQNAEATSLVIPANTRTDKSLAPARYMEEVEQDVQLAVDLVSETRKDKVDLLINDIYSAAFDQNGDFTKMMNTTNFNLYGVYPDDYLSFIAVDKVTAEQSIAIGYQVPEGGEYTLQLSDRAYVMTDAIEALYVTDHEVSPEVTTDLLDGPYNFTVNQAEINNTRFTVSIRLAPQTPTNIGNVPSDGMGIDNAKPRKFIWQDKMYILHNGVIYDATGKKVKGGLK